MSGLGKQGKSVTDIFGAVEVELGRGGCASNPNVARSGLKDTGVSEFRTRDPFGDVVRRTGTCHRRLLGCHGQNTASKQKKRRHKNADAEHRSSFFNLPT